MSNVTGITLSYDPSEDRIHISARLDDGRKVRLWLTQRMARNLVGALTQNLEKAEEIPVATVRQAVMTHSQAQAVSTIRPRPPVKPEPDVPAHLVTNIQVRIGAEKIALQLDSALDFSPRIVLDGTLTRQWLSMLHRQFVTAKWPLDVWPTWLIEGSAQPAASASTRH